MKIPPFEHKSVSNLVKRNLIIILIVFSLTISLTEFFLGLSSTDEQVCKPNSDLFNFEKSSIESLSSAVFTKEMLMIKDEDLHLFAGSTPYPLIEMETGIKYDDDTLNIVVIGDSFVWGDSCLNRNELFWRLLETDLRKKGYNCRVYGVGMVAANAYDELKWLKESSLVKDLDPDIVIFGYVYNDPSPQGVSDTKLQELDMSKIIPFASFMKKIIPNIYNRLCNYVIAKSIYNSNYSDNCFYYPDNSQMPIYITKGEIYEKYKNEFVIPLDNYAKKADFPIVYMTLPPLPSYTLLKALFKPLHTLFSEYKNVAFYDCLDEFCHNFASSKHSKNYSVNPLDLHPGSATNRFYADYLIDVLENDYSNILGKSSGKKLNNNDILINEWLPYRINLQETGRTDKSVTYTLDYPSCIREYKWMNNTFDKYLLNYPLGQDHIKLSFAEPVDIKSIEITGDKVNSIDLYYTKLDEDLGYDNHKILPFGTKSSDGELWTDSTGDKVTSICIHTNCVNQDGSGLKIKINS